ncbi:MAG TPA: glycosyltransferase 87 family protein [Terracidiphilus sp.]|nr:glycosyltransferase 87 family protein [Terracidiphilus sp.]
MDSGSVDEHTATVSTRQGVGRKIAAAGIIAAGVLFVTIVYSVGLTAKNATKRDFIQYWAAGKLILQHADPYSLPEVFQIERAAGMEETEPKISVAPPIALELFAPLGFLGAKSGLIVWLLVLLGCLSVAVFLCSLIFGEPDSRLHLFGYLFAPAIACVQAGQLGIFFLLGFVLFLYLHRSRPFLAGACLLPWALKPHLFLAFAAVLLLWSIQHRGLRLITGFFSALAASCGLSVLLDRNAWSQYINLFQYSRLMDVHLPTLSASLRAFTFPNAVWIEYLPAAIATIWAIWYYVTHRQVWEWTEHGLLVLLVSVMCTPYGWVTDETVLLPAVLFGVYRATSSRRSLLPIAMIGGAALVETLANVSMISWYYTWTTPAWLGWYLYATRNSKQPASAETAIQTT